MRAPEDKSLPHKRVLFRLWRLLKTFFVGNGEFFSSFSMTRGDNFSTPFTKHTLTETVLVFTFSSRRLKCSFHDE